MADWSGNNGFLISTAESELLFVADNGLAIPLANLASGGGYNANDYSIDMLARCTPPLPLVVRGLRPHLSCNVTSLPDSPPRLRNR